VIRFFLERPRGISVLTLVVFAWTYGFVLLNILPQWNRLDAAQGGREVQERAFASGQEVADVLATFTPDLRSDALTFYLLDIPNVLLLGAAVTAVMAFGLRNLGLARAPFAWILALPMIGAAADGVENAALATALLSEQAQLEASTVAAAATTVKRVLAFDVCLPLMLLLAAAGVIGWLWRLVRSQIAARA
jgi:hypothetical protein